MAMVNVKSARRGRRMKPVYVRYVRLFCAAAIFAAASMELATNWSELATLGWSSLFGAGAVIFAKKMTLLT